MYVQPRQDFLENVERTSDKIAVLTTVTMTGELHFSLHKGSLNFNMLQC